MDDDVKDAIESLRRWASFWTDDTRKIRSHMSWSATKVVEWFDSGELATLRDIVYAAGAMLSKLPKCDTPECGQMASCVVIDGHDRPMRCAGCADDWPVETDWRDELRALDAALAARKGGV